MCDGVCGRSREFIPISDGPAEHTRLATGADVAGRRIRLHRLHRALSYEFTTLIGIVVFTATGTRLRLAFVPLLLLLFLVNIGYMMGAVPYLGESTVTNWIITSWYMAATVMFVAMVVAEDTMARLDMLRRGLVAGGVIASLAESPVISTWYLAHMTC